MKKTAPASGRRDAAFVRDAVGHFLASAATPVLIEPGEEPIPLRPGCHELTERGGRILLHAWDDHRSVCRRLTGVALVRRDRLELTVERLGGKSGRLWLADQARPSAADLSRKTSRLAFQERFRGWLAQWFPEWRLRELTTEPDLEHSLSPVHPRAMLAHGSQRLAAIAAPLLARPGDVLTFGLLWLEYLRRHSPGMSSRLALFAPFGAHTCISQRFRYFDPSRVTLDLFAYTEETCGPVDLRDWGNLGTRLDPLIAPHPAGGVADLLAAIPEAAVLPAPDGSLRLRVKGLELARVTGTQGWFGLERKRPLPAGDPAELRLLAAEIARRRSARLGDPRDPVFSRAPEAWLEDQVRASLVSIDARLLPYPVYHQVPQWAGGDRGILDLLAVDGRGRLAVLELKASEDLHLPLQALDYWMRVKWHLEQGAFSALGYFPGIALCPEPPRLYLISPAMAFHSSTEQILRYWDPAIEVERVGVSATWRQRLEVVFRARGADPAGSFASSP